MLELRRGLHALPGDRNAERRGERGDCAHDRRIGRLRVDPAQERAVDLQLVDRQAAQIGEARVAGAEVVDGEAHAELADRFERGDVLGEARHQHALGDLELHLAALELVLAQD